MDTARRSAAVLSRLELFGVRLGLERMERLLAELGAPQRDLPAALVAGTNGKGSTAALLAAMSRAAGYRTGLYTSPHLETVTERISIDGRAIADERLAELLSEAVDRAAARGGDPPTYFEALTLAAFRHFAAAGVDLAVLEVGLGGRLDATNACDPTVSAITSIALDHEEHLGRTPAAVAREKAGVMRRGRPTVVWVEEPEVVAVLGAEAAARGAELVLAPERVTFVETAAPATAASGPPPPRQVRLTTARAGYPLQLALPGHHQLHNLAVATLAAEALAARGFWRLDAAAVAAGAAACRWPGRLEWIDLPGARPVILDAAHNPAGAAALGGWIERLAAPPDLLFGALADKAVAQMLPPLAARARRVFLTRPASPRSGDPAAWAALLPGRDPVIADDLARALTLALAEDGPPLVVCGSIYLVGAVRTLLRETYGVPAPVFAAA